MTNINQFLPFYIGCEMLTYWGEQKEILTLKGVIGDVAIYGYDKDYNTILHSWDMSDPETKHPDKPILRPLESMTEEHRKELWQLIFKGKFTTEFKGNTIWIDKDSLESSKRWVMMSGIERLGIEMNGDVWADSDLHKWKFNPHEVTKFFTDRFYDVFFLHSQGLCLYRNDKGELY
jgi:hypothetical protein